MSMPFHILVVKPPPHHPAAGLDFLKQVMFALEKLDLEFDYYPAGTAFFKDYLADAEFMSGRGGQQPGGQFWAKGKKFLSQLCSEAFFSPWSLVESLQWIDRALDFLTAGSDSCLDRRNFSNHRIAKAGDLYDFATDLHRNPFHHFNLCCGRPDDLHHDGVLFVVETAGQAVAAATLALDWKSRWPGVPMSIVGTKVPGVFNAVRVAAEVIDAHDQAAGKSSLSRLIARLGPVIETESKIGTVRQDLDLLKPPGQAVCVRNVIIEAGRYGKLPGDDELDDSCPVIVWHTSGADPAALAHRLHTCGRLGFWNHLVLTGVGKQVSALAEFASLNPNLVHSWCRQGDPLSLFSDPWQQYPCGCAVYGNTRPLEGRPFWQIVRDPEYLAILLSRWDSGRLRRVLVDQAQQGVSILGQRLRYHFQPPKELPPGIMDEICRMVEAGGTVKMNWVRHNLERAYLIAYVEEDGRIVANSSLKRPRREYVEAVGRQAGLNLEGFLERGYTSVRPEYRGMGIGAALLEGLTRRAGRRRIFSVIAEDNSATKKIALRNKTRKVAVFYSQRAGKEVGVWIPEWMLPGGVRVLE